MVYASPERVFEALTDAAVIDRWSQGAGGVTPREGGDFTFFDGWVKGKVLVYEPSRKLTVTWKPAEWDNNTPETVVAFSFQQHEAGTEIWLDHVGFVSTEEAEKHHAGWIDYVFDPLNDFFTDEGNAF